MLPHLPTATLAASPAMSLIPVASFAGDDYFCVVAKPTKEFLAVLPAKSEPGDVSEAESANNISEEISLGFVEVGLHHGSFGPIHQLCLAQFAMQVVGDLVSNCLARDFHRVSFTTACAAKSTGNFSCTATR